jgi:dolichyl-phosphate beta-glucosyltransferase
MVVPVYNESHRFVRFAPPLVEFTLDQPAGSQLLFVDDGSTDNTPDLIDELRSSSAAVNRRVRMLRCPHRGKGGAVRAGLQAATTPIAGFCDLDLSTSLPDFEQLIDRASSTGALVIASRHVAAARVTRDQGHLRQVLGRAFNAAARLTLVPGVADTQCGAKVARAELWRIMLQYCVEEGFAWDVELLAVAMRIGVPVQEVGVTWCHERGSTVRVARDGTEMLRALLRIRRRLRTQVRLGTTSLALSSVAE